MPTFRYACYPSAKVVDDAGKEIKHVLWGDWVRIEGDAQSGWFPVRVRGVDGWMHEDDLQDERLLEIVFVDVGQGDAALVVTPKDKHIVIDSGVGDNLFRFLRWRYSGFKKKWTFESAVMTHPDADHYRGFTELFEHENVHFETLYHNGIMEEWSPKLGPSAKRSGQRFLTHIVETRAHLKSFLGKKSRWRKPKSNGGFSYKQYPLLLSKAEASGRVGDIRMLSTQHSDQGFVPGYGANKELRIEVLGPVPHEHDGKTEMRAFGKDPKSKALDVGKTKNGHSVILKLSYRGFRVLLGGDLNRSFEAYLLGHYSGLDHAWPWSHDEEDEIVQAARASLESDIAKSCHHGAADVTDAMLRSINAAATVVSSGDEESHAHPRPETLGALGLYGRGRRPLLFSTELMRSSREDEGDAAERVASLRERIATAGTPAQKAKLRSELDELVDELTDRNVTTYGAINLRTDGRKAVMAYKLERPRTGPGRITEWDVYEIERAGTGPFVYTPGGGH